MSFWDRYLAPGDVRRQRQLDVSTSASLPPPPPANSPQTLKKPATPPRIDAAQRARRQDATFYGGLAFAAFSLFITARAIRHRRPQITLPSFTPSNTPPPKVESGLEAVQALGLATLSVSGIALALVGAAMKVFDIADVEDLREQVRRGAGFDVYGGDGAADRELEQWVAEVLSRKDDQGNLQEGIAKKLMELEQREKALKEQRGER